MSELPRSNKLDKVGEPIPGDKPGLNPASDPFAPSKSDSIDRYYSRDERPDRPASRHGEFSRFTWVMIVIAGVVLGFAIAMTFAGA